MNADVPAWWRSHEARWAVVAVVAIAVLASVTGLWNGFAYDDVLLIPENRAVHPLRGPLAYFQESYWGPITGQPALYRPVIVLGWAWQWALAGGAPWIFHLVNVLLYVGVAVALLAFLRQLMPHGAALMGTLLFVAHPVHVEAVANIVGQSELLVATLLLGSLALYARDRRRDGLRLGTRLLILGAFVVGLFTKEHAIVLPALLVTLEWAGRRLGFAGRATAWAEARQLVLLLGLIAGVYLLWRIQLLGAVTGDAPHWAVHNRTMAQRVAIMTALVPEFLRLLLFPLRLYSDYAPGLIPVLPSFGLQHLPGALILGATATGLLVAWRRGVALPVLAGVWFAVTFAPTSNVLFPVGVIMAERTLFLPSVALALLFGWAVGAAAGWTPLRRSLMVSLVAAGVLFGTVHSALRTRVWQDNATLFSTLVVEAPTNFRGLMMLGTVNSSAGRWATADSLYQLALSYYPEHVPARLAYVRELQVRGEFPRALEQVRLALRTDPEYPSAIESEVLCLLHAQRFSEARSRLLFVAGLGYSEGLLGRLRVVADSMLAVTDSADVRNRFLREGRPFARYTSPLVVRVEGERRAPMMMDGGLQRNARSATGGSPGTSVIVR